MPADQIKLHFVHQFRHLRHADGQMLDTLEATSPDAPERALRLMSHLLRAQDVWRGRVRGAAEQPAIWAEDTLAECRARAEASHAAWLGFLKGCGPDDFARTIHYENSKGRPFSNALREICGHVVNHSTHHRAQIAMLLREAGVAPPVTGYVYWARS